MKNKLFLLALSAAALTTLTACSTTDPKPAKAVAKIQATSGSKVEGELVFTQKPGGKVVMSTVISGLKPNSEHGFHIHELGNCADNGNAAGGHFNPTGGSHGKYDAPMHHMGDLPSLKADANGVAKLNVESKDLTLLAGAGNIVGRGVIVHANPDDYVSQPTGNAGGRIGCGVIVRDEQ